MAASRFFMLGYWFATCSLRKSRLGRECFNKNISNLSDKLIFRISVDGCFRAVYKLGTEALRTHSKKAQEELFWKIAALKIQL